MHQSLEQVNEYFRMQQLTPEDKQRFRDVWQAHIQCQFAFDVEKMKEVVSFKNAVNSDVLKIIEEIMEER